MTSLVEAVRQTRRWIDAAEGPVRGLLLARYDEAYRRIAVELDALTRQVAMARAAEEVSPDWLRRQARYRALLASIDREVGRFAGEGAQVVAAGQREAAAVGRAAGMAQAVAAGYTVDVGSALVSSQAQARLFGSLWSTSPVADTLGRYPAVVREIIERELFAGLAEGLGPREVTRRIRRAANGPLVQARLATLVRTELMRAARGGLVDQYGALGVDRVVWRATKSTRTCLACLAMDGTEYAVADAPDHFHPNCRCVLSPVPRMSSVRIQSGEAWFASRPASVQRRMLGEVAYTAYRRGEVTLADFVGWRQDPRYGATIIERSAGQVLRGKRRRAA